MSAQKSLEFVVSNTAAVQTKAYEARLPSIVYPELVRVDTSANAFSQSVVSYNSASSGGASFTDTAAGDFPTVDLAREQSVIQVKTAGIAYGHSIEEIGMAQLTNTPLAADSAIAARRAYEEFVDEAVLTGHGANEGLLNSSGTTVHAAGSISGKVGEARFKALVELFKGMATATENSVMPNTVLLPSLVMIDMASELVTNLNITWLEMLRNNNPYTVATGMALNVKGLRQLDALNKVVAYNKADDVVKIDIPMPLEFQAPYWQNPTYVQIAGVFRLAPLNIIRKKEFISSAA